MRKLLMLVTMLVVPALASAWTLPVKVTNTTAGINAGNKVRVVYQGTKKINNVDTFGTYSTGWITSGTKYVYPPEDAATATLRIDNTANVNFVKVNNATVATNANVVVNKAAFITAEVAYFTTVTASKGNVSVVQTPGGMTQLQVGSSSTVKGFTNVPYNTNVTVKANPSTGYYTTKIAVNDGVTTTETAGAGPVTFPVAALSYTVTATYQTSPAVTGATLTLSSPLPGTSQSGPVGTTVTATVNATGANGYTWTVSKTGGSVTILTGQGTNEITFAAAEGANMVQVSIAGGSVPVVKNATYMGYNATTVNNYACTSCHSGSTPAVVAAFNASGHPAAEVTCQTCHTSIPHNAVPVVAVANCTPCHGGTFALPTAAAAHVASSNGGCITCHAVGQNAGPGYVQDNNGVRSITQEFTKWSHHVTGVELQNAHCAACHLEGKAQGGVIVVDPTYHMADAKTHLRNADTDADMQWDPAAPNHTTMDNFCMSCHDANGATSTASAAIRAIMVPAAGKTASATNPFGDTISNRYDKMQRPAVVNVDDQFDTTNNSHHGVKGPRYSGRTRAAGDRQIASPATFAANSSATLYGARSTIYDAVNPMTKLSEQATNPAFTTLYTPLENAGGEAAPRTGAQTLGDDSTLHCGDCHTVGQWKPNAAKNADGTNAAAAIGAHGSNNEYMLRNDKGTDERHTQEAYTVSAGVVTYKAPNSARLICYNCHAFKRYGSVYSATGATGPHAGEYDSAGRCNGVGNTIPFNGYTTGTATDGTQFYSRFGEHDVTIPVGGSYTAASGKVYTNTGTAASTVNTTLSDFAGTQAFAPGFPLVAANSPTGVLAGDYTGEQVADFGNVFGIQCLNCHNSGIGNGYGGIHGSANNSPGTAKTLAAGNYGPTGPDPSVTGGAYVDGMGNTNKVQRFLPGLGNIMHVPGTLGGFTEGTQGASKQFGTFYSGNFYTITSGAIANDTNWEQIGWKQIANNPTGGATGLGAGCYTLNDEHSGAPGTGLDRPESASYGIKGQSYDGGATIPNASKTWGGCDDHTGVSVGGGDHGFYKRINRPVTY